VATDAAIDAVWARVPDAGCKGLCSDCCGPIAMSDAERDRIRRRHGITIRDAEAKPGTLECPALGPDRRCTVYDDRPTICRLWASVAALPCPHGCTPPGGHLTDAQAALALAAAQDLDGTNRPDDILITAVTADPTAGPLLARAMRGDRSIYPALAAAVQHVMEDL
jgi:hypothetical protein